MLFRIKHLESRRVQVDYRSADLGRPTVTQLVADGEVLVNAVHSDTWSTDPTQVMVCAACGIERCEAGGWVSPRRASGVVLWLPAFSSMAESEADAVEYRPPTYFSTRGVPVFDEQLFAAASPRPRGLWTPTDLPALRSNELVLAMQWIAPGQILGTHPGPVAVREADVLAVSSGEREARLRELATLLAGALRSLEPVALRALGAADEPIVFHLDTPGHPAWSPLAIVDGAPRLHFEGLGVSC